MAVAGLRFKGPGVWELLTKWIVPGAVFPVRPGFLVPALEALREEVHVAWWRREDPPPPPGRRIVALEPFPTHRMTLSGNPEEYWRQNGHFKTVRNKRNRCRGFAFAVNRPGTAEWTIRNWESRWRAASRQEDPSLEDRIAAARYLEDRGKYFTLCLFDGDKPIAGGSLIADGSDLVAGVLYYEPAYERHGVGDRLIDLSFSFATEKNFRVLDIGGGKDYKRHWAPQEGTTWTFIVNPRPITRIGRTADWMKRIGRRILGPVRRPGGQAKKCSPR